MSTEESRIHAEYGIDVTFVTFTDENILDEQQIKELGDAVLPVVDRNENKRLVLNFENVRFMSSSFLGLLVKVHKHVCEKEGHLRLVNLDPKLLDVFQITRLDRVFDIA